MCACTQIIEKNGDYNHVQKSIMFTSDNQRKDAIYRLLGLKRYMNSAGESEDKYLDMYGSVSVTPFGDTPDTIK